MAELCRSLFLFRFQSSIALDELTASKSPKVICMHEQSSLRYLLYSTSMRSVDKHIGKQADLKPLVKPALNDKGFLSNIRITASFTLNRTHTYNLHKCSDFRLVKCSYLRWNILKGNIWVDVAFTIQILGKKTIFKQTFLKHIISLENTHICTRVLC